MASEEAAKPSPFPPYPEMILAAIEDLGIKNRNGSNKSFIYNYIEGKYGKLSPVHAQLLTAHLQRMRNTELIFHKNNYFHQDAPYAPPRRGRGRPPKVKNPLEAAVKQAAAGMPEPRGRPPKKAKTEDGAPPAPAPAPAPALVPAGDGSTPVKHGRGRPPKNKPECWKLQHSKPEQLAEMFHGVAVDGSPSCIPAQAQFVQDADGDEEGEDANGDGFDNNPMSTSSHERGSSSTDTSKIPSKNSKARLLNLMHELIQELQSYREDANQNLHQFKSNKAIKEKQEKEVDQQIDRCLRMAVECGATEESEEYFKATMLFEKEYNRKIFCKFNTAEGRFMWLKRWCQRSHG